MDLNKLYFQHQIAVMASSSETNVEVRVERRAEAAAIARRIQTFQLGAGAKAARTWGGRWLPDGQWLPEQDRLASGMSA